LIQIKSKWRVLLTGTPLQNNLQELVVSRSLVTGTRADRIPQSLLNFIHEDIFEEAEEHLRQIFKVHNKGSANMLSQQRVSRARAMMTPFVLRRRKAQVGLSRRPSCAV
jgi:SWI/SNF-related matrix-associated actin-dependent regulator 1 of chromatin subfamily A